jgi:hypothetical protein
MVTKISNLFISSLHVQSSGNAEKSLTEDESFNRQWDEEDEEEAMMNNKLDSPVLDDELRRFVKSGNLIPRS